jgi:hypothetical protein
MKKAFCMFLGFSCALFMGALSYSGVQRMLIAETASDLSTSWPDKTLVWQEDVSALKLLDGGSFVTINGGGGGVSGPGGSTDNAIARFDGTSGSTLQNSGVTIADDGEMTMIAGTTTAAPFNAPAGTLLSTAEDGAFEVDANCAYFTTDAGNRGVLPAIHFIRCDSARTLPNNSNLNPIFNSPANGRITLETGTYLFEMLVGITSMSSTSGNAMLNVLGAGTATVGDWLYANIGKDGTLASVNAVLGTMPVTSSTPTSMFTSGTATEMWWITKGTFTVTAAGTLIPSIAQATASSASVAIGSYFMCYRVGGTSVASVGQWD